MDKTVDFIEFVNHYIPDYKDLATLIISLISTLFAVGTFLVAFFAYRSANGWIRNHFDRNKLSSAASIRSDLLRIKSLGREVNGCKNLSSKIINVTNSQLDAIRHQASHSQLNDQKISIFNCFNPTINLVSELIRNLRDVSDSINQAMLGIKDVASNSNDYISLVRGVEEVNVSLNDINESLSAALVELMIAQSNVLTYDGVQSIDGIKNQNSNGLRIIISSFDNVSGLYSSSISKIIEKVLSIKIINII